MRQDHALNLLRQRWASLSVGLATIFLAGCVTSPAPAPGPGGTLTGKLTVEWVRENRFIYRPDAKDPLTFLTTDGRRITPRIMYTNGGSIPPILQPIPGFSPWGYAPAYIVHDWLFEQHHCNYAGAEEISFDDSARILGEVIDTVMRLGLAPMNPPARSLIEAGVRTPIARQLWDTGKCDTPQPAVLRAAPRGTPILQLDYSVKR
jgi:hypothetical protein